MWSLKITEIGSQIFFEQVFQQQILDSYKGLWCPRSKGVSNDYSSDPEWPARKGLLVCCDRFFSSHI